MGKVVTNTGATVWAQDMLYKSVSQSVLLYGSESWVVMGEMLNVLEGFHYQVARRITRVTAQCTMDWEWDWPLVDEAMENAVLWPIK